MAAAIDEEACEADMALDAWEHVTAEEGEVLDEPELAAKGIHLLINNKWPEAEKLFQNHRNTSPLMHAGSSFVTFMQALMTFEDDKLSEAMKALQETEKVCESGNGLMKSMRKKLGKKKKTSSERSVALEDRLQRQILVADTIMYQAVLTFINADLSSYVKGGWLLRKAWKIYDKAYREISTMYERINNTSGNNPSVDVAPVLTTSSSSQALTKSPSSDSLQSVLPDDVVSRLLGGVSFGYGSFQLCISMMPPKILKIIEWLGFEGDRTGGLECLYFSSNSTDMKAPLATFGLLWYHTMIRPFFALDGGNIDAGVEEAMQIIEKSEREYPESALFLFFKGRAYRLQCKLDESLSIYRTALDSCGDQREIQLICLHEIGWLHMMALNWQEALQCFSKLKEESRWSKSYYAYLSALCHGALGNIDSAKTGCEDVFKLVRRKNNQIEQFVTRRAERLKKMAVTQEYCVLLLLEVLYLWNSLPTCAKPCIKQMLEETGKQRDKKTFHLQSLIEGALYRELEDEEMSKTCFEEAIARHQGMKEDQHVAAFSMYELGSILVKSPAGQEEAKKYFNKAKDSYKDFDFENRLNVRVHAALKRMKTEGTPV